MFHIIERRGLYFAISILLMVPGIIYMVWSLATKGELLPLSIDYTGGTLWEIRLNDPAHAQDVRQVFVEAGYADTNVFTVGDERTYEVKLKTIDATEKTAIQEALNAKFGTFEELSYRSIGPTMGNEVSRSAIIAVTIASVLILIYISLAFRQVTHPFRFGTCAVAALIHDVLVTLSFVCIMNLIAGWEVDALFLTAILTIIGFSVHDTIVVFDRMRENYRRYRGESLTILANRSIVETMQRSLGTVITTLLSLVAVWVLGGSTLQQFVGTLTVGMISGAYSSIFNATALLVAWDEGSWLHREPVTTPNNNNQTVLA